jgi:hypothetical protein
MNLEDLLTEREKNKKYLPGEYHRGFDEALAMMIRKSQEEGNEVYTRCNRCLDFLIDGRCPKKFLPCFGNTFDTK